MIAAQQVPSFLAAIAAVVVCGPATSPGLLLGPPAPLLPIFALRGSQQGLDLLRTHTHTQRTLRAARTLTPTAPHSARLGGAGIRPSPPREAPTGDWASGRTSFYGHGARGRVGGVGCRRGGSPRHFAAQPPPPPPHLHQPPGGVQVVDDRLRLHLLPHSSSPGGAAPRDPPHPTARERTEGRGAAAAEPHRAASRRERGGAGGAEA